MRSPRAYHTGAFCIKMPRQSFHQSGKWKIYPSGDVYFNRQYRFKISDDREFAYIWEDGYKSDKKKLSVLLSEYPESLAFLQDVPLAEKQNDSMDLGELIKRSLAPVPVTIDGKLARIMRGETKDRQFRDETFAEALILILQMFQR